MSLLRCSLSLMALASVCAVTAPFAQAQESLVLTSAAPAASKAPVREPINLEMMAKIREEGMQRSQLPQNLAYLTDVIGPRLTGSPGLDKANDWTVMKFKEWGLNAKLQPWGPFGRGWTLERFSAQAVSPQCIPLIAFPKAWSPGWNGTKTAEVVYLDAADEKDLEKYKGKLKGKFVLLTPPRDVSARFEADGRRWTEEQLMAMAENAPRQASGNRGQEAASLTPEQRRELQARTQAIRLTPVKLRFALDEGALAALDPGRGDVGTVFVQQASVALPRDARPGTRIAPQSKEAEGNILPQVAVSIEHYNRLIRLIEAGEKVELAMELKTKFNENPGLMVNNVIAEMPGTDKAEEIVMCGGHIDSWQAGTGATDNAAGVAVCMEAVRILKALGVQPRRTIRVGLWTGEEQGIFGSRAYVEQQFGSRLQPKAEHEKFSAYFNLDNGTGKIRGVYCQGNEAIMPIFAEWLKPFGDLGATTITARNTGGTDHLPFDAAGLPGFQFVQDPIEYNARTHHSNQDTYDRIQVEDMKQAAVIMAAFLYNAAMRDDKLPRKPAAEPR
ncbi:MAG: hypothetical protein OHK0029_42000 [Armatimonadaceae bacterium]